MLSNVIKVVPQNCQLRIPATSNNISVDWTCGNRCLSKSYQIVLSTNFYQMGTRDCQILSQKNIDMLSKSYQAFSIKQYHSLSNGFRSEKSSRACLGGQRFFECFYKWGNPQIINFKGTLHHKPAGLWHGHPSTLCHGSQTHAFPSELFRIQVWTKKNITNPSNFPAGHKPAWWVQQVLDQCHGRLATVPSILVGAWGDCQSPGDVWALHHCDSIIALCDKLVNQFDRDLNPPSFFLHVPPNSVLELEVEEQLRAPEFHPQHDSLRTKPP